jgi:hypothetical protein
MAPNKRISVPLTDDQDKFLTERAETEGTSQAHQAAQAIRTGLIIEDLRAKGEIIAEMPDGTQVVIADKEGVLTYRPIKGER